MAAPRLILRFRELTPDVDTIAAHEAIVTAAVYVWWGWWKKESEPDQKADLVELENEVRSEGGCDAWLIDTSAERLYRATIADIRIGELPPEEKPHVPEYYRDGGRVAAWFKITAIQKGLEYDPRVEFRVGQDTLAILKGKEL